jgi:uncharacterized membrane protein
LAKESQHGLPPDAEASESEEAVAQMEMIVSYVLRYGVLLSFAIVLLGSVWFFVSGRAGYADLGTSGKSVVQKLVSFQSGSGTATWPTTPGGTFSGLGQGKPYAVIAFGLLVLIATPVLRVAVTVFTFLWERDRLYALITAYVLTMLIISFIIGKGG